MTAISSRLSSLSSLFCVGCLFGSLFGFLAGSSPLRAQTESGTLEGTVRSESGAPLPDALVRAGAVEARTAEDGSFRMTLVSGAPITVTITAPGHLAEERVIEPLREGEVRRIGVTLNPLFALDAVRVVTPPERPLLNTESAETGGAVERREIRMLPTDARDPIALAFTIPGVSQSTGFFGDAPILTIQGGSGLYTRYTLDGLENTEGFLGGPRTQLPITALERLDVRASTYRPAFGRSTNGVVDLRTRAGGEVWEGEFDVVQRPGTPIDSDPKFTPSGINPDGFERLQLAANFGGPLVEGRTFIFGAVEFTDEKEDRIGSTARTDFVGTEDRETWKAFLRLDHGWSETQTTTLRSTFTDVRREGQGGGVIVPEADITTRRIGSATSLMHRTSLREGLGSNTFSAQVSTFTWDFPPSASDLSTPQVTIVGPDETTTEAVVGSSNFIFDESELQIQLRNEFELRLGHSHTLGVGAEYVRSSFNLTGANTNPQGAYVVVNEGNINPAGPIVSIRDIPSDVRVLSFSIDAQPQEVDLSQTLLSAWVEDRWRITPTFTLQAGVRWDYDDITSRGESDPDLNNIQPRFSFNWLASPETVIRGGWGLYAGVFPYAVLSDAQQFGPEGNAVVTFEEGTDFLPPAFLEGPTPEEIAQLEGALPPREVRRTFARGLEQPMASQFSLGVQREFGEKWGLTVDGVWVERYHLPRSFDLNPVDFTLTAADSVDRSPAFGDSLRPIDPAQSGFRRLTTTDTGGRERYLGLHTTLRHVVSRSFSAEATWVWSLTKNDTEDINFNATSGNDFDAEWADAINDRRHHMTLRSVWSAHRDLTVAGIVDVQSGTPVNRIAFFRDLDGSGTIFGNGFVGNEDRFAGVPRNGERLPWAWRVDMTLDWRPVFLQGAVLRAEAFNLFNRRNFTGFANGIPGGGPRTQVGRPGDPFEFTTAASPREFQFSLGWTLR
ncbi:MAG: TonB-dependent receptor [Longimicrobiales bacterium]|nr:TonB-dependent receptor [Longimicrobiales bacterium]